MNESELRALLHEIATAFQIGSAVRDASTIMTNVENAHNHEFCIKPPSERVLELAEKLSVPAECATMIDSEREEIRQYVITAAGWDYNSDEDEDEYNDL